MSKYHKIALWMLLGPITAPLVAGIFRNFRRHEPILASLYGLALAVAWFDFAELGARTAGALGSFFR